MVAWPRGRFLSMFLKLRKINTIEKELDDLIVTVRKCNFKKCNALVTA